MAEERHEHIRRNYDAFQAQLPHLAAYRGKFALMYDGTIVEYFDTARDAYIAGKKLFPDNLFSVQEVTDTPVDLGFFSHAMPHRAT